MRLLVGGEIPEASRTDKWLCEGPEPARWIGEAHALQNAALMGTEFPHEHWGVSRRPPQAYQYGRPPQAGPC
jgi:hypothetical protein